jgi:hypothetical protein
MIMGLRSSILISDDQSFSVQPDFTAMRELDLAKDVTEAHQFGISSDDSKFSLQPDIDQSARRLDANSKGRANSVAAVRWKLEFIN